MCDSYKSGSQWKCLRYSFPFSCCQINNRRDKRKRKNLSPIQMENHLLQFSSISLCRHHFDQRKLAPFTLSNDVTLKFFLNLSLFWLTSFLFSLFNVDFRYIRQTKVKRRMPLKKNRSLKWNKKMTQVIQQIKIDRKIFEKCMDI